MATQMTKITEAQIASNIGSKVTVRSNVDNSEVRGVATLQNGNWAMLMNGRAQFYIPTNPTVPGFVFTTGD
jgi:hypothetical protein